MMNFTVIYELLQVCFGHYNKTDNLFISKRCEKIQFTGTQIALMFVFDYTEMDLSSDTCTTQLLHIQTPRTNGWIDVQVFNETQLTHRHNSCKVSESFKIREVFQSRKEINTNSSNLLYFITGNEQFTLTLECSCTNDSASLETFKQPGGILLLLVGSILMGVSFIFTIAVIISVCCLRKRYKMLDKTEDSKHIKSSQGDTYEVIKETDDGHFTISAYQAVGGTNEFNTDINTRHMSKSSGQSHRHVVSSADSLYSLADGDEKRKQKESSIYQEDYETISHTVLQLSNCKVATPFLLATSDGSFTLPQLKSVTPKLKGIPSSTSSTDISTAMTEMPVSSPTDNKESTYQALDHSGRSRSVDLTVMASYDDVVDVRPMKSPRQHCNTADVVLTNVKQFDFKPKFFSENIYSVQRTGDNTYSLQRTGDNTYSLQRTGDNTYSLQRTVENGESNADDGDVEDEEREEHIYEAYSQEDTEQKVNGKNTPTNITQVVTMKPPAAINEDILYDKCQVMELGLPSLRNETDDVHNLPSLRNETDDVHNLPSLRNETDDVHNLPSLRNETDDVHNLPSLRNETDDVHNLPSLRNETDDVHNLPSLRNETDDVHNLQEFNQQKNVSELVQGTGDSDIGQSLDSMTTDKLNCGIQEMSLPLEQTHNDKVIMNGKNVSVTCDNSHIDMSITSESTSETTNADSKTGENL